MPKRKAEALKESEKAPKSKKSKGNFLAHCKRVLPKVVKKAKTFETQKIAKHLKKYDQTATSQIEELKLELEAIKAIPVESFVICAVEKRAGEDKVLAAKLATVPHFEPEAEDSRAAKARERLYHSRVLQEGLAQLVPAKGAKSEKKIKLAEEAYESESDVGEKGAREVASDSQVDEEEEASPASRPAKQPRLSTSTFLPSLAAGFTAGDSDNESDVSIDPDDGDKPLRKNRRGQRARRQIWERKYGKQANHVKKEKEAEQLAQAAVDARKKARGGISSNRKTFDKPTNPNFTEPLPTQREQPSRQEERSEVLHPSWQAKKQAQEKASLGVVGGAVTGTKIRFD